MTFSKNQKMGLGLISGTIGGLILGITLWTNTSSWLSTASSTILIIGGFIYWLIIKEK